jgi:hypothetical protein
MMRFVGGPLDGSGGEQPTQVATRRNRTGSFEVGQSDGLADFMYASALSPRPAASEAYRASTPTLSLSMLVLMSVFSVASGCR